MFSQGYIIDSQICILVLYVFYRTVLEGRIPHRTARSYLMTMIPISLLIPLVSLPLLAAPTVTLMAEPEIEYVTEYEFSEHIAKSINYLLIVYLTGVSIMALWILIGAVKLMLIMRKNRPERIEGLRVVFANQKITAYSVFNYIFINTALKNSTMLNELLAHEECHIKLRHSMDLLYMSTMRSLLWFNPVVWHIGSKLRQVHEYQVDEQVIEQGYSKVRYINLLIMTETGITPELASPFSYQLTKKRLTMLSNRKQNRSHKRLLIILPTFAALLTAFSLTTQAAVTIISPRAAERTVITDATTQSQADIEIHVSSDNQFEVNLSKLQPADKIILLSEVIKIADKPNSGTDTIQIKKITNNVTNEVVPVQNGLNSKGLVVIDGIFEKDINSISPSDIESVAVLKSEAATSIYGEEKGKNGVILITTKNCPKFQPTNMDSVIVRKKDGVTTSTHKNAKGAPDSVVIVGYGKLKNSQDSVTISYTKKFKPESDPGTVILADVMPKFDGGGVEKFKEWAQQNIKYPESAVKNGIQGKITLQFTVDVNGNVQNPRIIRGLSSELDREALEVVKKSPKWTPGSNQGKPVSVAFVMPLEFKLSK